MGGPTHESLLAELACRAEDAGRVLLDDLLAALERRPRRGEVGRADLERLRHRGVVAADGDLVVALLGVDVVDLVDATGRSADLAVTPFDAVGLIDRLVARVPRHRELGGERSGDTIGDGEVDLHRTAPPRCPTSLGANHAAGYVASWMVAGGR